VLQLLHAGAEKEILFDAVQFERWQAGVEGQKYRKT
jgi:hypothetical protein